jgi:class 3 adenylate cyclase
VWGAAVLEKTLHLELARVHYERAEASGDPAGYGLDDILVATEQLTGGQARSQLEVLGLPADLNARIRDAIERRNAILHRPLEDADLARAVGTGEGIEAVVERIERLALDCGELGVELERFAGDKLAAMLGLSREQMAQMVTTLDPATIPDERMRAQVEAVQASGIDLSQHPYPRTE